MAATISQTLVISRFGSIYRMIAGIVVGLATTVALFWVMPYMIETTDRQLDKSGSTNLVDFVRLRRDETIQRRELKPRKPLPPQSPPPLPSTPKFESLNPNAQTIAISAMPVETDIELSGAGFSLGWAFRVVVQLLRVLINQLAYKLEEDVDALLLGVKELEREIEKDRHLIAKVKLVEVLGRLAAREGGLDF